MVFIKLQMRSYCDANKSDAFQFIKEEWQESGVVELTAEIKQNFRIPIAEFK